MISRLEQPTVTGASAPQNAALSVQSDHRVYIENDTGRTQKILFKTMLSIGGYPNPPFAEEWYRIEFQANSFLKDSYPMQLNLPNGIGRPGHYYAIGTTHYWGPDGYKVSPVGMADVRVTSLGPRGVRVANVVEAQAIKISEDEAFKLLRDMEDEKVA